MMRKATSCFRLCGGRFFLLILLSVLFILFSTLSLLQEGHQIESSVVSSLASFRILPSTSDSSKREEQEAHIASTGQQLDDNKKITPYSRAKVIAAKYGFTNNPDAVRLIEEISRQNVVYNEESDLLYFYHPPKTGGTSISKVLEKLGGVVPSSHAYGWFSKDQFLKQQSEDLVATNKTLSKEGWWKSRHILYTHTKMREHVGGEEFVTWLQKEIPPNLKTLKLMTMIRDPFDRIASAFQDYVCEIHYRLRSAAETFNLDRRKEPCLDLNLTQLADNWLHNFLIPKCLNDPESLKNTYQYPLCKKIHNTTTEDPLPQCRSVPAFLNSTDYEEEHNFYVKLMMPQMETANHSSVAHVEVKALRQLGGLTSDDIGAPLLWFGITERMPESICLLHYTLKLPYSKTPKDRVKKCRPLHWFRNDGDKKIREREALDYPIHRAANAIMDIRVDQMCSEIQAMNLSETPRPSYIPDFCCKP